MTTTAPAPTTFDPTTTIPFDGPSARSPTPIDWLAKLISTIGPIVATTDEHQTRIVPAKYAKGVRDEYTLRREVLNLPIGQAYITKSQVADETKARRIARSELNKMTMQDLGDLWNSTPGMPRSRPRYKRGHVERLMPSFTAKYRKTADQAPPRD